MLEQLLNKEDLKIQRVRKEGQEAVEKVKIKREMMYLSNSGLPQLIHRAHTQLGPILSMASIMFSPKVFNQLLDPLAIRPPHLFPLSSKALVHPDSPSLPGHLSLDNSPFLVLYAPRTSPRLQARYTFSLTLHG